MNIFCSTGRHHHHPLRNTCHLPHTSFALLHPLGLHPAQANLGAPHTSHPQELGQTVLPVSTSMQARLTATAWLVLAACGLSSAQATKRMKPLLNQQARDDLPWQLARFTAVQTHQHPYYHPFAPWLAAFHPLQFTPTCRLIPGRLSPSPHVGVSERTQCRCMCHYHVLCNDHGRFL